MTRVISVRLRILLSDAGQEIIEAAIVFPLLFMLLLGIYWFGRAFNIYGTINHAAREGARVAMVSSCASCGNAPASSSSLATAVTNSLIASRLDPNQAQAFTPTPAPVACQAISAPLCSTVVLPPYTGTIYLCSPVQINPPPGASNSNPICGVTVSFQYPYQFWFPFTSLNMQQVLLKASVQSYGEQ